VSGPHDPSQPLTPDEIERRSFGIEQRGYDRDQVRGFLYEVAAALRLALQGNQSPLFAPLPPWSRAADAADAQTVAALGPDDPAFEADRIMRAAHVSAASRQEEADAVAKVIVEQARLAADELRGRAEADAEQQRDRARRVLVAAQEEAAALVAEAEKKARRVMGGARQDALNHAQQVSHTLEVRAEELIAAEKTTLGRLNEARRELSALIEALAGAEPVLGPTVEILRLAVDARTAGEASIAPALASGGVPTPRRPGGPDATDTAEPPGARMVRAAVARAQEAATPAGAAPPPPSPGPPDAADPPDRDGADDAAEADRRRRGGRRGRSGRLR
jgi:DivIVA domain-containing protein